MDMKKITLDMTKVDRDSFLRKTLSPYLSNSKLQQIVASDCVAKDLDPNILKMITRGLVKQRCFMTASLSMTSSISGIAGTLIMLPLDCAQFAYHAMKLSQELYYIHGTRNMFTYQSKDELELLVYMLAGAGSAISISTSSLSVIGQKLYQKIFLKMHMRSVAMVPFVGCAIHGSLSGYALYTLAEEYVERLEAMANEHVKTTPAQVAKEIGTFIDVEYREVEDKLRNFCNLEKLREYYQYLEAGYLSQEEFEQLKLVL